MLDNLTNIGAALPRAVLLRLTAGRSEGWKTLRSLSPDT